jgi:hypothetical protein
MVDFKTRDEFLSAIMSMLVQRPDARLMLIIDSNIGLEIMQTEKSFIWSFGAVAATEKLLDDNYRTMIDANTTRRMEEIADAQMMAGAESSKGSN